MLGQGLESKDFILLQSFRTGSGAFLASCFMGTRDLFPHTPSRRARRTTFIHPCNTAAASQRKDHRQCWGLFTCVFWSRNRKRDGMNVAWSQGKDLPCICAVAAGSYYAIEKNLWNAATLPLCVHSRTCSYTVFCTVRLFTLSQYDPP